MRTWLILLPFLAMGVAWLVILRTRNGGWADAVWPFATGLTGVLAAVGPELLSGEPLSHRQALVAGLALAWSVRLGTYIGRRTLGAHEDARYAELRKTWGEAYPTKLFMFLQLQALAALPLSGAIVLAAMRPGHGLDALDMAGALILLAGVLGGAVADRQLEQFKADPANRGRICDTGLWAWSRHPNYFFEWLAWCAWPVIALDMTGSAPLGLLAMAAPLLMYGLLVHGSGIPPLEAHMERSRGAAFAAYKARTPAFWPWPPGRAAAQAKGG